MSRSSTKARKERKRERREKEERVTLAPEDALDIIDDDLPDGAYWALMEEMTGMDAGEFAEWHQGVDDDE